MMQFLIRHTEDNTLATVKNGTGGKSKTRDEIHTCVSLMMRTQYPTLVNR